MAPAPCPHNIGKLEARLDAHDVAIKDIRDTQREDRDEIRGLKNWIMGTLAAALGGTVLQIITMLASRKAGG